MTDTKQPAHAKFSPSSAEKWAHCYGAMSLEATLPPEKEGGTYKEEGTLAHSILEQCLSLGMGADSLTDDLEMIEAVEMTVAYVNQRVEETGCRVLLEHKLTMTVDWWGTADIILTGDDWIEVIDFKYGRGVLVEIINNAQLQSYAVGAYLHVPVKGKEVKQVITTIAQPRIYHPDGRIRSETYDKDQLTEHFNRFMDAIEAIKGGDDTLSPSVTACKWCRAKSICPAIAEKALKDANVWFEGEETLPAVQTLEQRAVISPDQLTMEQRVRILKNIELIRGFLKAVEADSLELAISKAGAIPGFKVVEGGNTQRKFTEEDSVEKKLRNLKFKVVEITKSTLLGPAPIERLLKKAVRAEQISQRQADNIMKYVIKPAGKKTLVPESDPRPAAIESPEQMFGNCEVTTEGE